MSIDLSKMELTRATPWTPEEELAEAQAWGYDSVEAWLTDMNTDAQQAIQDANEMNQNMQQYGTIDKPKGVNW